MATITKITQHKLKKNRYSIFLDGTYAFSITDETLFKNNLREGLALSPGDQEKLLRDDSKVSALGAAFNLLSYRGRSAKELQARLKLKKYDTQTVMQTSKKLADLGYLNDGAFALNWAQTRKNQGKGRELIKSELKQKGVDTEYIEQAISSLYKTAQEEIEHIQAIAVKKLKNMGSLPAETIQRRLLGFLSRKGFPVDKIFEALRLVRKDLSREE